nr:MAG: nonstructural polyprotein [Astroviridae sp.]
MAIDCAKKRKSEPRAIMDRNSFSSIDDRYTRQIQAELGKVVGPQGANQCLARTKDLAKGSPLWSKFLAQSIAIVCKEVRCWYGLFRDGTWHKFELGNVTRLDQVEDPRIPYADKAMCYEKLRAATRTKNMEDLISHQNRRIVQANEKIGELERKLEKANDRISYLELENLRLKKQNLKLAIEAEKSRVGEEKIREASGFTLSWNGLAYLLFFLFFLWLIPNTQAKEIGCTLIEAPIKMKPLEYGELATRCLKENGETLLSSQYDENYAFITCMASRESSQWCRRGIKNLIARRLNWQEVVNDYMEPVYKAWGVLMAIYGHAHAYSLDQLIVVALAIVYTSDKKRAWLSAVVHVVCYFTGSKVFPLMLVLHYLPLLSLPFLAVALLVPPQYGLLIAFVHYLTLLLDACFPKAGEQTTLLQRISGASLGGVSFVVWQFVNMTLQVVQISLGVQVMVFLAILVTHAGVTLAVAQVTVTNPDGTVTKYKRFTQVRKTIADGVTSLWQKAKAVRGVVPAFPVSHDAVALVEAELADGPVLGTAFRLGNYIYTAGHVVKGATKVSLVWNGLKVQAQVIGEIDLPLFTDTMVRMKVPAAFGLMKSLRLAKATENDYFQLITFGQNSEPVTFTGWGTLDAPYFSAPFATHGGTSGSPIVDRTGKVVAMHFGSNLACSSGYMLTDLFKTEPPVKQGTISDEVMEKLMTGVRNSTAGIMAKIEDLTLRTKALEDFADETVSENRKLAKEIDRVNSKVDDVCKSLNTKLTSIEEMIKILHDITVQQAKPKTKARMALRKKLQKTKMLTEEEYKRLQDEGYTPEEIGEVVNNLRESAFLEWDMEHESDWEENPDWDDEPVELAREQKARLKVHIEQPDKQKTLDIQYPDGDEDQAREDLKNIVKDDPVPEGETHVVLYYDDAGAIYIDDKRVSLKKIKLEGSTRIQKSKETVIGGTPQQPKVQKISTTTKEMEQKTEQEHEKPQEKQVEGPDSAETTVEQKRGGARLDQRARVKCTVCGTEMSLNKAPRHKCPKNGKGAPSGAR